MYALLQEYSVSVACFTGVVLVLLQTWFFKKDFFRPTTIYIFIQCLTLGIAYLKINPAMSDFKPVTWMAWIGAMVAFILGNACYQMMKDKSYAGDVKEVTPARDYNWNRHFIVCCLFTALFVVGVFGMIAKVGTITVLAADVGRWCGADVDWGISSVFVMSSPLITLYWGLLAFKGINSEKRFKKIAVICMIVIPVLSMMMMPSRGVFMMNVAFIIMYKNYFMSRVKISSILMLFVLAIVFFIVAASVRSQLGGGSNVQSMVIKKVIELPYNYIANNFWNLDYALNPTPDRDVHPRTYGIDVLASAFEYFRVPGSVKRSLGWDSMFNESTRKVAGYNTTGYLWELYKDWGMAGCILAPFLMSFALSFFYDKTTRSGKPTLWIYYTFLLYYVGWSFFCAGFKTPTFWAWLYIMWLVSTFCEVKPAKQLEKNTVAIENGVTDAH